MFESTITAVQIARRDGVPVFPVNAKTKRPALSNKALERLFGEKIGRGQGGFKAASLDAKKIKLMFEEAGDGVSVAVPMGTITGLVCIDVDAYKGGRALQWLTSNDHLLRQTRTHTTQNGGFHYLFQMPDCRLPQQLDEGVDVKGEGGYVLWPPSAGYVDSTPDDRHTNTGEPCPPAEFPMALLDDVEVGGSGMSGFTGSGDDTATLVQRLVSAQDFHDSLRTLSARAITHGQEPDDVVRQLTAVMNDSVARSSNHPRHEDWLARIEGIERMVDGAVKKFGDPLLNIDVSGLAALSFSGVDFSASEPVRKPRAGIARDYSEMHVIELDEIHDVHLKPIVWWLRGVLPQSSVVSFTGNSAVGKTRFMAAMVVCLAAGATELLGFETCEPMNVLWFANEDRADDIKRRVRAAVREHGLSSRANRIYLRGKDGGALRLVEVDEYGQTVENQENIDWIMELIRRHDIKVVVFDPYVTLSLGLDENNAAGSNHLNDVLQRIAVSTECTLIHIHHAPKGEKSAQADWYRRDLSAWRGSSVIYTALDMGFTLAPWVPKLPGGNTEAARNARRRFDQVMERFPDEVTSFIWLDSAKVREGRRLPATMLRMVSVELPEGGDIGAVRLSSVSEAESVYEDLENRVIAEALGAQDD